MKLTSATARVSLPNTGFGVGTGDFTLDIWVKVHDEFVGSTLLQLNENYAAWDIRCGLGTNILCWSYDDTCPCTSGAGLGFCTAQKPPTGWHHWAYQRQAGSATLWVDGKLESTDGSSTVIQALSPVSIGKPAGYPATEALPALVGPTRFSKVARYAGPFTPEKRWVVDANTVAQWLVDQPLGTTLVDEAGGENTSTSVAQAVAWDQDTPCTQ